jgi:hypothetical protein
MKAKIHIYVRGKEFSEDQKQIIRRVSTVLQLHELYVSVELRTKSKKPQLKITKSA